MNTEMFVKETYRTKPRWAWKVIGIVVIAPLLTVAIMLMDHHHKAYEKRHLDKMMLPIPPMGQGG